MHIIDGQPTTTTQDIAEVFGKRHDHVLRIVRQRMEEAGEWRLPNFGETVIERENPSGGEPIKSPVIRMTEKGFMFVVQTQIAYVDEFERMRAALMQSAQAGRPALDYARITPAQAQTLKELVQAVVDGGEPWKTHGETWARLHSKFRVNRFEVASVPPHTRG